MRLPSTILHPCRPAAGSFILWSLVAACGASPLVAQAPVSPALRIDNGQQQLAIEKLSIEVQVVGNLATTTWDITFRNSQNRVLEGELVFPLGEGQTVSRFALPVNGVLREGVVVEKAKGRQAFEEVVRRPTRIDPGLLEKTEGNAFRTRIYPIPALGTYRVVLAYEQELQPDGRSELRYQLPLAMKGRVGAFSFRMEVLEQALRPDLRRAFRGLEFQSAGRAWRAEHHASNIQLDQGLDIALPRPQGGQALFLHQEGGRRTFYAQVELPAAREPKEKPRRLLVVWDASASAAARDLARERKLLAAYLNSLGIATVEVAVMRNETEATRTFEVVDGKAAELFAFLSSLPLDGGTRLDSVHLADRKVDEVLLFTDGLSNLGRPEPQLPDAPVIAVNSATLASHALLRHLAESRSGEYLDLQVLKDREALDALGSRPLAFLGYSGAPGDVHEVYPSKGTVVRGAFGIAGLQVNEKARVTLRFGYGKRVTQTRELVLDAALATAHASARRIWAQKKLASLQQEPERNRTAILGLGQDFGIVTEETSLIVLEAVEDYVRHRIAPPPELRAAYDQQLQAVARGKQQNRENQVSQLVARFEELKGWWRQEFKPAEVQTPKAAPAPIPAPRAAAAVPAQPAPVAPPPAPSATPAQAPVVSETLPPMMPGTATLTGVVTDPQGRPLPNVRIQIELLGSGGSRSTSRVMVCDGQGAFRFPLLPHGRFRVSASLDGYSSVQGQVDLERINQQAMTLNLHPAAMATVEVVASAQQIDATTVTASMSISSDSIQRVPRNRDQRATAHLAPGVSGAAGATRSENQYLLNGASTSDAGARSAPSAGSPLPSGSIQLSAWNQDMPYLKVLREAEAADRYAAYLTLRKAYGSGPGFYLDVCDFFESAKEHALALRVLTNLAELNLDDPALLRVLGHRLLQFGDRDLAVEVFERVLRLREEEPQSLRDLGLALTAAGRHQEAAEVLYKVATSPWDGRFPDVDIIALNELNTLLASQKVDIAAFDPRLLAALPVDIRVVMTWDTADSDMDLHVTDPRGETCNFRHARTATGGRISRDVTQGYGPEEFLLRHALPGTYRIQANYYGTRQQTAVIGPTTLNVTLFLDFGTPRQARKDIILRLDGRGRMVDAGTFEIHPSPAP